MNHEVGNLKSYHNVCIHSMIDVYHCSHGRKAEHEDTDTCKILTKSFLGM